MFPPAFVQNNITPVQYLAVKEANDIYQNIISRKLYRQVIEIGEDAGTLEFMNSFLNYLLGKYPSYSREDFIILKNKIGFVSGNKADPFESIYFYDKKENNNTFTIKKTHISALMNDQIQEIHWHLFCKRRSIYHNVLEELKIYSSSLQ